MVLSLLVLTMEKTIDVKHNRKERQSIFKQNKIVSGASDKNVSSLSCGEATHIVILQSLRGHKSWNHAITTILKVQKQVKLGFEITTLAVKTIMIQELCTGSWVNLLYNSLEDATPSTLVLSLPFQ